MTRVFSRQAADPVEFKTFSGNGLPYSSLHTYNPNPLILPAASLQEQQKKPRPFHGCVHTQVYASLFVLTGLTVLTASFLLSTFRFHHHLCTQRTAGVPCHNA